MTIHVRWPARPAEHRAGLDFFGSFCIKAKRTEGCLNNFISFHLPGREGVKNDLLRLYLLSFACAKESNKEKHTANDVRPLADALIKL